jgi:hypothetical protein
MESSKEEHNPPRKERGQLNKSAAPGKPWTMLNLVTVTWLSTLPDCVIEHLRLNLVTFKSHMLQGSSSLLTHHLTSQPSLFGV